MRHKVTPYLATHLRPNRAGAHPIYIRVSVQGRMLYISTGLVLNPVFWAKAKVRVRRNYIHEGEYNTLIDRAKARVEKVVLAHYMDGGAMDYEGLKTALKAPKKRRGRLRQLIPIYLADKGEGHRPAGRPHQKNKIGWGEWGVKYLYFYTSFSNCRTAVLNSVSFHTSKSMSIL